MVYQMVSRTDPETMRFLDDVVTLLVHANPDGNDLVADWYMRNPVPEQRSMAQLPRLYQKYIGHDQPGVLHLDPGRNQEYQSRPLSRLVPPDSLQPSPERAGRHRGVFPAAPGPLQLQSRSGADPGTPVARRRDAHPARGRGQAGRDDALGRTL